MDETRQSLERPNAPLTPNSTVLEQEIEQAVNELKRPSVGLMMSGLIAGFAMGTSLLAIALLTAEGAHLSPLALRLAVAQAYAVGFVIVILSHTDLFTEYTTIALLPVLAGRARLRQLLRFWLIIYGANLVGGFLFSAILVLISPALEIAGADTYSQLGIAVSEQPAWLMVLSASLTGWLMGLMGWLVSASRDTIGQIVFVWLVASVIGIGDLHHSIVGAMKVFAALLVDGPVTPGAAARFLLLVTVGNIFGGSIFAVSIRYSVPIIGEKGEGRSS